MIGYENVDRLKVVDIKVYTVPNAEQNFKKLLAGRIDVFPESMIVGYALINKTLPPEKAFCLLIISKKIWGERGMYMLISKEIPNGQEIADQLDAGL